MGRTENKWITSDIIFFVSAIFLIISAAIGAGLSSQYIAYNGETLQDFSEGWETSDGQTVSLKDISRISNGKGQTVELSKKLPDDLEKTTDLNFRSKGVFFTVFIDDTQVYDFHPHMNNLTGRSYGNAFHFIHLSEKYAGQTVRIKVIPIYDDGSCFFNMVKIGNSGDYYQWFMKSHFSSYLLSLNIIGFGILLLIIVVLVRHEKRMCFNMATLGITAILSGIWSCIQTLVPQIMLGDMGLWHGLNYLMIFLIPYPTMCFVSSLFEEPKRKYDKMVLGVTFVSMFACALLNSFHIMDYHETLPIAHGAALVELVIGIVSVVDNTKSIRGPVQKDPVLRISFCIFLGSVLIDMVRYAVADNGTDDTGFFMRFGLWLFIMIMFYRAMVSLVEYMKLAAETDTIKKIAYTDALTGIPNRASFVRKEMELRRDIESGEKKRILVCQMDVNDLKSANDGFGHAFGDEFLMKVSYAINTAFCDIGTCYRVGGDEFTVFVTKEPIVENYERAICAMKELEQKFNDSPDMKMPINIAYGASIFPDDAGTSEETIEQAERDADREMYVMKSEMKNAEGD